MLKIGPQGIPHQPRSSVSRVHGNPLVSVLSPAEMKYTADERRNVIKTTEMQ
jgi:hypothetical protein